MSPREQFRERSAEEWQNCPQTTLFRWNTLNQGWNLTPYTQYKRQKGILSRKNDQHETPRNVLQKETGRYMFVPLIVVLALTVERTIIHKSNVDLMLDMHVINATVLVTKLDFVG